MITSGKGVRESITNVLSLQLNSQSLTYPLRTMSRTLQPSYWCIENLGDLDPVQHGGKFVCIDRRGIYAPILLILQEPENKKRLCHEIELERCFIVRDSGGEMKGVGANHYHADKTEWFGGYSDLKSIASFADYNSEKALAELLASQNILDRAQAYGSVVDYFGAHQFDQAPREYDKRGAEDFVALMFRQRAESRSWHDGFGFV